jgi:hypothetical protein
LFSSLEMTIVLGPRMLPVVAGSVNAECAGR